MDIGLRTAGPRARGKMDLGLWQMDFWLRADEPRAMGR